MLENIKLPQANIGMTRKKTRYSFKEEEKNSSPASNSSLSGIQDPDNSLQPHPDSFRIRDATKR